MMTTQLTAFISRYYLGSTKDCEENSHLKLNMYDINQGA